ncbi:MAG TPA: hypothetical protein VJN89_14275 [Candidatus Acidoferrum sp.]|nr:hypothetical protein [Candidatus Acidoferrum sp.]
MDHLSNWIEIPVLDMERAKKSYSVLLDVSLNGMRLSGNDYGLIDVKDRFNTGCLVKGDWRECRCRESDREVAEVS